MPNLYISNIKREGLKADGVREMSVMNIDERLTTSQAAQRAAVTSQTIRAWVHDGRLTASRLPTGQYRIAVSDLERVLSPEQPNDQPEAS